MVRVLRPLMVILTLVFGLVALAYAADQDKPAPASEEVLTLKLEVQQLQETLRAVQFQGAQCDALYADTRAKLNSLTLTQDGERLKSGREQLTDLAKASGFAIEDVLDKDGKPTGQQRLKKVDAPPKDQAKK